MSTQRQVFQADLARMNAVIAKAKALITFDDGSQGIDPTKLPESFTDTYANLLSFGYSNGLL